MGSAAVRRTVMAVLCLGAFAAATATTPSAATARGHTAEDGRSWMPRQIVVRENGERETLAEPKPGETWSEAMQRLRSNPDVAYATPNWIAEAASVPNDPGSSKPPIHGGWTADQWNLLSPMEGSLFGISATLAWDRLAQLGAAGAKGVTVAIVDSGIAYRKLGKRFRRSPDLAAKRFTKGRDFVDGDKVPLDRSGHGTHVAGTIGQQTGNGRMLSGIAYRAKLMPVRVLDAKDRGNAHAIARGIRWATKHGADVINLSLSFPTCEGGAMKNCVKSCADIAGVCNAISKAIGAGIVVVAAAGNGTNDVTYPARFSADGLIAVGASALNGTRAPYSPPATAVELLAPGGPAQPVRCLTKPQPGAIVQVSFRKRKPGSFCIQRRWGTSMSAAHVSGAAALVIAAARAGGVLSASQPPTPAQIEDQLLCSANHINPKPAGSEVGLGSGIVDAAKAVTATCGTAG